MGIIEWLQRFAIAVFYLVFYPWAIYLYIELLVGCLVHLGWIKADGDGACARFARNARDSALRWWLDAKWFLVAALIMLGCLLACGLVLLVYILGAVATQSAVL